MNFDKCFELLMKHEGGYVFDKRDPGGETKYGISKRAYPNENIKNLTMDRAKKIYKKDYWDRCKCDLLPSKLALHIFDFAVNSGNIKAIKDLQKMVGVDDDGIIGPKTMEAIKKHSESNLIAAYCNARVNFLQLLKTWDVYKRGWVRRIMGNINVTGVDTDAIKRLYSYLEDLVR